MMRRLAVSTLVTGLVLGTAVVPASGQQESGAATAAADTRGAACPGAPGTEFGDVPDVNVHKDNIELGVLLGIVRGTAPNTFAPAAPIRRGQVASLLARTLEAGHIELPSLDGAPTFPDQGVVHADNIRRLAAAGIVEGREDGQFRTNRPVRRDQLASMLVRTVEWLVDDDLEPEERGHFPDVRTGVHAENVDLAFELELMEGKRNGRFAPADSTRRDQAASVVIRFLDLVNGEHEGVNEVTFLHDTHFHGKYVQTVSGTDLDIGRYFALVEQRLDDLDGTGLFLANGDDIAPSVYSGLFEPKGIHMIDALNEAPVDVNTFGNHEFDYGPDNLREIIQAADFPYVTANVRDVDTCEVFGADLGVEEFLVFEVDGLNVGVTGLAPEGMASITTMGPDTEQVPAQQALEFVVPRMRAAGADLIVVSSHLCGPDALALADLDLGVHLYAGDHCAINPQFYVSDQPGGAIVSLVSDEYEFLGEVTLEVTDGEVSDSSRTLHALRDLVGGLTPLPAIQDVVDDYDERLSAELDVVIGERTVAWDTRNENLRNQENAAGNFFTDQMRAYTGPNVSNIDIAVTNSGGIRGNQVYPAGEITRRHIAEIFPFGNRLVVAEISGATLLEALEHSVAAAPGLNGRFLQVSGIEFTYDSSLAAGARVQTVTINGAPLDPSRTYVMATNDFTLGGGDGFTMFQGLNVLVDGNAGPVLDSYLIDRIEGLDAPVSTEVEGRIVDVA
ncbi:5'-nucleotidase C-terminal domain-containing protein [Egicoccus sp. AB-alg2]|uniref:5'-nucleotidase C-terminal domain-containing protein n=1 Tax=Egicoccus sp. AB-alg2 TaxID=3242693 RepID=UPI00359DB83A